jgi:hypothetical protein
MRGTDVLQRRATGRPATAIEADMDRLFARRVTVFGPVSLGDSTEAVLNTVLKVRCGCVRVSRGGNVWSDCCGVVFPVALLLHSVTVVPPVVQAIARF